MRFGGEYVEAVLATQGRRLMVADAGEVKDDLVQDMLDVVTFGPEPGPKALTAILAS